VLHMLFEVVVGAASVTLCVYLINYLFKIKTHSEKLESQMKQLEQEYHEWKQRSSGYIQGLTQEIDDQLTAWELSPAEKEIALLLLKGFTNKEIARTRNTSEHTIKQQASAVYRKSGLKTRAEISAFFLGDLLPARLDSPVAPPPQAQV
jgi:DNA-binding NarL/FixJ family response regulator